MTEMSRIERKKREQEKASAEMNREAAAAVELETLDEEIPSRRTYHKKEVQQKRIKTEIHYSRLLQSCLFHSDHRLRGVHVHAESRRRYRP
ncbi:hypothetical protein PO124_16330 [Bacillus licheniformis]|nr:hypothetical protein [Bacillus licheniformis]